MNERTPEQEAEVQAYIARLRAEGRWPSEADFARIQQFVVTPERLAEEERVRTLRWAWARVNDGSVKVGRA